MNTSSSWTSSPEGATLEYDPRYLAGILFFNSRDFFEAHEVWESIWLECAGPERSFYQGLIQAAVGLFHFSGGNLRGARKLYHTSRAYMAKYESPYLGLDHVEFWRQMTDCFRVVLEEANPEPSIRPDEALMPTIRLNPEPECWPDPNNYLEGEEAE